MTHKSVWAGSGMAVLATAALVGQIIVVSGPPKVMPPIVEPACTVTSDGSVSDTQTLASAASAGDVVCIPAGTFTWAEDLVIAESIELVGVGGRGTKAQCEIEAQTTYTCINGNNRQLTWTTVSTGSPRLAGITFYGESCSDCGGVYVGAYVVIAGTSPNFRLHDVLIDNGTSLASGHSALIIRGYVRGVGWNSECVQRNQNNHCFVVLHDRWAGDAAAFGDKSWSEPSTIGASDAWYWEDITLTHADAGAIQSYFTDDFRGARVVYRFNTITNGSIQNHGTETGGRFRSYREVDYYRNNVSNTLYDAPGVLNFRGGSGYGHGNVFTSSGSGSFKKTFAGSTFRRDDASRPNGWQPWNRCGTYSATITRSGTTATVTETAHRVHTTGSYVTISGADQAEYNDTFWAFSATVDTYTFTVSGSPATPATGTITARSPFDGNTDSTGYPCLDQFGAGAGAYLSGDTPVSPTFIPMSPLDGMNQASQPVYIWANTWNGSATSLAISGLPDVVEDNRDLFNQNASYNGTSERGVYVGTSLPANCTTGDAAWITDEGSWNTETAAIHANHGSNHTEGEDGKRYACTATDTWTAKYGANSTGEPYAYPHPLRGGS